MKYWKKISGTYQFILFYIYDLCISAVRIAWDVITVRNISKPGIVKVPLELEGIVQITAFSNLVTFSPGSMVIYMADDLSYMMVHSMFVESDKQAIANIKKLEAKFMRMVI